MNLVLPLDSFVLPYAQYVYLAIGIGMLVGLIFSETLGVMGGGLIVPGYFALHLQDYFSVFITFFIGCFFYYLSTNKKLNDKQVLLRKRIMNFFLIIAFLCLIYSWL